jgi:hypothetical protein
MRRQPSISQWSRAITEQLTAAQTKDDVVATYNRFSAFLEEKREQRAAVRSAEGMSRDHEYLALIAYAFPDKFSQ